VPVTKVEDATMRQLPIVWQRLVVGGKTCDRCGETQGEVERAVAVLGEVLGPLGIEPVLEIREIDDPTFRADPSQSNRIWVKGRPIEDWLAAKVGSSQCCSVCGDAECRTVEVDGTTFEAIPERVLIRAALVASSEMLGDA
jgi:hypothetical protein